MCTDFLPNGLIAIDTGQPTDDYGSSVKVPLHVYKVADTDGWYGSSGFDWIKPAASRIFAYDDTWYHSENVL